MQNLGSVCAVKSGDNRNAHVELDQPWSNRCGSSGCISFEEEISYLAWCSSYHGDHSLRQAVMILASPTATDFWPPVLIPHHKMEHQNRSKNYFQRWKTLYPAMHIQSGFGNHVIFYQAIFNTIRIHSEGFRPHNFTHISSWLVSNQEMSYRIGTPNTLERQAASPPVILIPTHSLPQPAPPRAEA